MPKIVAQCRKLAHSPSLYIAEHTRLVPKNEELSAANQNRARKNTSTSSANQNRVLRNPSRQPIRIEYYDTRVEYHVTRELSARLEDPSRLSAAIAYLNT